MRSKYSNTDKKSMMMTLSEISPIYAPRTPNVPKMNRFTFEHQAMKSSPNNNESLSVENSPMKDG